VSNDFETRRLKTPSFPLLKEGDVPLFEGSAERLASDHGGYLPEPEVLSILDGKPHPEKRDYLPILGAVLAVVLLAAAIRVVWYYSTNRVDLGTSPLEKQAQSAPVAPQPVVDPNAPPEDDTLYYADSGVTLPVLRSKFAPPGKPGDKVGLLVVIDPTGKPVDARVWQGLDPDTNVRALEAAGKWRFRPATKDGKPVPVLAQLEIEFR
jgi:hypothetical protein